MDTNYTFMQLCNIQIMDAKLILISFNKADGIIKIYNGVRYLKLSNLYTEVYYRIYNAIFIMNI